MQIYSTLELRRSQYPQSLRGSKICIKPRSNSIIILLPALPEWSHKTHLQPCSNTLCMFCNIPQPSKAGDEKQRRSSTFSLPSASAQHRSDYIALLPASSNWKLACRTETTLYHRGWWCCDVKKVSFAPKCTAMTEGRVLTQRPPRYKNACIVWSEQLHAADCRKHVCLPKAAGDSKVPKWRPERDRDWAKMKPLMVKELPGCQTVTPNGGRLEAGEVHNRLDEDGVVTNVSVLAIELRERAEEWTAAGDVHLAHGSLEGGGSDIRSKGIDDVLSVALVQQHQRNLEVK